MTTQNTPATPDPRPATLEDVTALASLQERFRHDKSRLTPRESLDRWHEISEAAQVVIDQAMLRAGDGTGNSNEAANQAIKSLETANEEIQRLDKIIKRETAISSDALLDDLVCDLMGPEKSKKESEK